MAFVFDPDRLNGTGDPCPFDVGATPRSGRGVVEQRLVPLDTEVLWRCVAALSVGLAEVEIDAHAKTGLRGRRRYSLATKPKCTSSAWRRRPPSSPRSAKAEARPSISFRNDRAPAAAAAWTTTLGRKQNDRFGEGRPQKRMRGFRPNRAGWGAVGSY